ncbi:MAG: response regulator [Caulobacteraceae bacterium]|nr:response regulator [Caulobacteraceae bacterium]
MRFNLLKILVVDDNHHMRTILTEVLRAIGVRDVYEATNGAEALQKMRTQPIDIVIADLAMEPVDGIELVRLLRNAPDSPNQMVPVIMVTGHSTERRVKEARDVGANEFLGKPVTARGVLERIQEVIDHARPYVRCESYFGPDRRRHEDAGYAGPRRRSSDKTEESA